MRFRYLVLGGGSAVVLLALLLTQPDVAVIQQLPFGGTFVAWLVGLGAVCVGALPVWLIRKALHDYPEADMRTLFRIASGSPEGAGRALMALAIVALGICIMVAPLVAKAAPYPAAAEQHLPTLRAEIEAHWPQHPMPEYFGGLIEHESCLSLTHPRCWSATSRLRSAREEGAGLGQITRTWHPDGRERFDTLRELRSRHASLGEWSWENVYERPDLQLRGVVLFARDLWGRLHDVQDERERLAMADAAYNGGLGRVASDRRACSLTAGCEAQRWWGHVERTCTAGRAPLYGRRSACDINRHHVHDVIKARAPKYLAALTP